MSSHNPHLSATTELTSSDEHSSEAEPQNDSIESQLKVRSQAVASQKEIGGRGGLEPTRYGDWEKAGRCIDF